MRSRWAMLGGVLGVTYCVAGFVMIFIGWNGAASTDRTPEQIPYVMSGGLTGLALVVLGSALIATQSLRRDRVELRAAIDELRLAVARLDRESRSSGAASDPNVVVAGPRSFHRPGCTLVEGQVDAVEMTVAEAVSSGRTPCRTCDPPTNERGAHGSS